MYSTLLAFASVLLVSCTAWADDAPFITERPGFNTSPQTLPKGRIQVEAGLDVDPNGDSLSLPVSVARFGAFDRMEFQLGWGGLSFVPGDDAVNDLFINAKVAVAEQNGAMPNIGIIVGTTVPVDDGRSFSDTQTTIGGLWSHDLEHGFSLFGTITAVTQSVANKRDWAGTNAIGIAKSLPDNFGAFFELFSRFDDRAGDAHIVDFGLTYLLRPELQLDVSGGVGVSGPSAFDFISLGISTRW